MKHTCEKLHPKVLLTAGGTGGHIFPAIAIAEDLMENHSCQVLFAGGKLSKNPYFDQLKYSYKDVACDQFSIFPMQFFKASYKLLKGIKDSIRIIRNFNPDIVIGFGSYYTLPVLIASKLLRKPLFLHEANSVPGRVNKLFAPLAETTLVHFPSTTTLIPGPSTYGGMPLRSRFRKSMLSKAEARKLFQLDPKLNTFLIFGGSQGSKKINAIFSEAVLFHLKGQIPNFQVIHLTGSHEDAEQLMGRYVCAGIPAYVRPFEKRMEVAWAAADLSITRAGAASIAEQYEFEIPGILIPYPFATDKHQDKNADYLVEAHLGIKILEENLTPSHLAGKIQELMIHAEERLKAFSQFKIKQESIQVSMSEKILDWMDRRMNEISK